MAKPGKPNKSEPRVDTLSFDIRDGNNENVKTVLFEVGIDALDGYQRTSLIWASFYNNTELLKWLIDNGADINHQERNGFSALHFAGKEQRYDTAAILIENKADLEIKDSKGNTPLMDAIFNSNGDYKIVDLLIVSGANLDNVNNHEMTPKLLAESMAGIYRQHNDGRKKTTANSTYKKLAIQRSSDTFVVNHSSVLRTNFNTEKSPIANVQKVLCNCKKLLNN